MAGKKMFVADNLKNFVSGLGTERSKSYHSTFVDRLYTDHELMATYRQNWVAGRIIDVPAFDCTRSWRNWQAKGRHIERIEKLERDLGLQGKIRQAKQLGDLLGGAAVYIGTNAADVSKPLNVQTEKVKYLTVFTKSQLSGGERDNDIASEYFGQPKFYRLSTADVQIEIHPSRLIRFMGKPIPDTDAAGSINNGWGDSVLVSCMAPLLRNESTAANAGELVFESKVDVIGVPDLMSNLADAEYRSSVLEMISLQVQAKGITKTLLMDAAQTYNSHNATFAGVPELIREFQQECSGASGIPRSILFGNAEGGLNNKGEAESRIWSERVSSIQAQEFSPAMAKFDELLLWNALGRHPSDVYYIWNNIWKPTKKEEADIGKVVADTLKTLVDTGLFNQDALSKAGINMLTEQGVVPGLEGAMEEFGNELGEEPETTQPRVNANDAEPRTLYVSRKVTNSAEILSWAKAQGFGETLSADDLHVTIAYSKTPVDWMKMGSEWSSEKNGGLVVKPGGPRVVERLGEEGAVVLMFASSDLSWRNRYMREEGASWDYEDYQPHVTISYNAGDLDLRKVEPYTGKIVLGPEIFEEIDE